MPMSLKPAPKKGEKKTAATVKVRPAMWPEDEYFEILAVKDRGQSSDAKSASYEEYKDDKGAQKFRLNTETLQRELIRRHLVNWQVRAGEDAPLSEQIKKKGWLDFTPEAVENLLEGPASFIENEINSRAGWLANIDVTIQTATGPSTADFPGPGDSLA